MRARFNGTCLECGEAIKVGKEIVKDEKGNWIHKHCAQDNDDLP